MAMSVSGEMFRLLRVSESRNNEASGCSHCFSFCVLPMLIAVSCSGNSVGTLRKLLTVWVQLHGPWYG